MTKCGKTKSLSVVEELCKCIQTDLSNNCVPRRLKTVQFAAFDSFECRLLTFSLLCLCELSHQETQNTEHILKYCDRNVFCLAPSCKGAGRETHWTLGQPTLTSCRKQTRQNPNMTPNLRGKCLLCQNIKIQGLDQYSDNQKWFEAELWYRFTGESQWSMNAI